MSKDFKIDKVWREEDTAYDRAQLSNADQEGAFGNTDSHGKFQFDKRNGAEAIALDDQIDNLTAQQNYIQAEIKKTTKRLSETNAYVSKNADEPVPMQEWAFWDKGALAIFLAGAVVILTASGVSAYSLWVSSDIPKISDNNMMALIVSMLMPCMGIALEAVTSSLR